MSELYQNLMIALFIVALFVMIIDNINNDGGMM